MDKPRNTFRVVGQARVELDVERFAAAIIAFALHRLHTDNEPESPAGQTDQAATEQDEEPSP